MPLRNYSLADGGASEAHSRRMVEDSPAEVYMKQVTRPACRCRITRISPAGVSKEGAVMSMKMFRRALQALAMVVIWVGNPAQMRADELGCPADWGTCVQQCTNPDGVCDNAYPGCSYDAYCSGAPCFDLTMQHVYCILAIET